MRKTLVAMDRVPPEIWQLVFSKITKQHDLGHLWTQCRQVSRTFRAGVEYIFLIKQLPRTEIIFYERWCWLRRRNEPPPFEYDGAAMVYDRLESDRSVAVFRCITHGVSIYSAHWSSIPKSCFPSPVPYLIVGPQHLVRIRGEVNDTELPGLEINEQKREISFDWREAYNRFFFEERLYNNYMETKVYHFTSRSLHTLITLQQDPPTVFGKGGQKILETKHGSVTTSAFDAVSFDNGAMRGCRKLARRHRVQRQLVASGFTEVSFADDDTAANKKFALGILEDARYMFEF